MAFELFNLTCRRVLVNGSSQGIGLAIGHGLAAHGARVVLNGRDRNKLGAAAASLTRRWWAIPSYQRGSKSARRSAARAMSTN
ncbi:SDR family NAD(P)-dependent oxidoreductase [Bradyrhizobium ontarionense]|uniref:SDR family NAD(P)-dependent oxidoreductase n=1 Tax=Bradyrhizobium ontarionense TaxID=2898149 RepID=UPI003CE54EF3